jgi:hypothetical protein
LAEAVALLFCIQEVASSELDWGTNYRDETFEKLLLSQQENFGIAHQNMSFGFL